MEARFKVEEVKHSKLGASSSERWMNCPGSIQMTAKLGDNVRKSGGEAALGTAAHTVGAACLEAGQEVWEHAGEIVECRDWKFTVDEDMSASVQVYVDYVRQRFEQFKDKGAKLFVEYGMNTVLDDDGFGTADAIIYVPGDRIIVIDFKNGMLTVEPHVSQLKYYGALAVERLLDDDDACKIVELVIVQPRMPHPEGLIRKHVMSVAEITEWFQNEAVPAMAATRDPNAVLHVGEWCRFCPARDACPAMKGAISSFTVTSDPVALLDNEVGDYLTLAKAIAGYISSLEEEALKRVRMGRAIPGWKLVKKKGNRVFKETIIEERPVEGKEEPDRIEVKLDEAMKAAFGPAMWEEPKVKSPPRIEAIGPEGKAFVRRWAYSPDTGETLAPLSDKRPAVKPMMDRLDDAEAKAAEPVI